MVTCSSGTMIPPSYAGSLVRCTCRARRTMHARRTPRELRRNARNSPIRGARPRYPATRERRRPFPIVSPPRVRRAKQAGCKLGC